MRRSRSLWAVNHHLHCHANTFNHSLARSGPLTWWSAGRREVYEQTRSSAGRSPVVR